MTPKQQRFVEEYLIDLNATQAAIRAGYKEDSAGAVGHENLKKPEIAEAIAAAQQERSQRTKIDAAWVLRRLAGEAEADISELYQEDGQLKPVHQWPMVFRKGLVTGFEVVTEFVGSGEERRAVTVRKVKLQDRTKTVELIGKHVDVGAFKERLEHSGGLNVSISQTENEL